jgi:predicted permease
VLQYGTRLRSGLLLGQASLTVLLLAGALLFARSLGTLQSMPLGYDVDRVLVATPTFRPTPLETEAMRNVYRALLAQAQNLPGVQAASWARTAPALGTIPSRLYVQGIDSVGALGSFAQNAVSPDYFSVMNTRIVQGRGFTEQDHANAPGVALVSERMASALWPGREAVGQCLRVGADTAGCTTVVGVTEDVVNSMWARLQGGRQPFYFYLSVEQGTTGDGRILLRTVGNPASHAESVRHALQRVMPGASYITVQPMRATMNIYHRPWRLGAHSFGAFGLLALVIAAVGLYGVISYNIAQRMHELSVRVALGARRTNIARIVVGQSTALALGGVAIGSGLVIVASRWIQPLLFGQSALDPRVFGLVAAVMLLVALVASALPALRAMRADARGALRVG